MDVLQASDTPARVVTAEKQTLITNVSQKLHSEKSYEIKALILLSSFYCPYAKE